MIRLSKEAEGRQQQLLRLEEEQELLKAQILYTREKNGMVKKELEGKKGNMSELEQRNEKQKEKNRMMK